MEKKATLRWQRTVSVIMCLCVLACARACCSTHPLSVGASDLLLILPCATAFLSPALDIGFRPTKKKNCSFYLFILYFKKKKKVLILFVYPIFQKEKSVNFICLSYIYILI